MKLSAPPRSARPSKRIVTDVTGKATKPSDEMYSTPDATAASHGQLIGRDPAMERTPN
jgi:hypothetical protein